MVKEYIQLTAENGNNINAILPNPLNLNDYDNNNSTKWYVGIHSASFFFSFPNILTNQTLGYTVGATNKSIIIPAGLYSVDLLSSQISILLTNNGDPNNLFVLLANDATQKCLLQINSTTTIVKWTTSTVLQEITGFTSDSGPVAISGEYVYAQNQAKFNTISSINIHSSISTGIYSNTNNQINNSSINTNATISDVICNVQITASVGNQVQFLAFNIIYSKLSAYFINNIQIYLTDQNNNLVENNDPWDLILIITDTP